MNQSFPESDFSNWDLISQISFAASDDDMQNGQPKINGSLSAQFDLTKECDQTDEIEDIVSPPTKKAKNNEEKRGSHIIIPAYDPRQELRNFYVKHTTKMIDPLSSFARIQDIFLQQQLSTNVS